MAEGTYEYECNRAELLGIDPPNRADFEAALKVQQEETEKELANEVEANEEQINNTSGKFDELNNILSVTQQRLNKFKTACGSLTNLLKIRGNQKTEMPDSLQPTTSNEEGDSSNSGNQSTHTDTLDSSEAIQPQSSKGNASSMQQKMSCQFDKLDAMINKAENAQYSMSHQNKQMKGFLK